MENQLRQLIPIGEINTGLDWVRQKEDQEKIEKHVMGAVGADDYPVINKGGQWLDTWLKMPMECQRGARIETQGCTGFGTSNMFEMNALYKYKKAINISDRALLWMDGNTHNGNTVDAPIDCLRKQGFLFENEWGWDRDTFDWGDFYTQISQQLLNLAHSRVPQWIIKHQYVPVNPGAMWAALETSVLGVTVYAWLKDSNDGLYKSYGYTPNHFTLVGGGKWGSYWLGLDQYPENFDYHDLDPMHYTKKLDWNYGFGCVKRYSIVAASQADKISLLLKFRNMIINQIKINWFKDKNNPAAGLAAGQWFITKEDPKRRKEVKTLNDVLAVIESTLASLEVHFDKTDWGEIGTYTPVDKF